MFCPSCRDEFRPGFTRCERCQTDLVEDLSQVEQQRRPSGPAGQPTMVRMVDFCGFLQRDDAHDARMTLRKQLIRAEVVQREPLDADLNAPPQDEYWLRVDAARLGEVQALLNEPSPVEADEEDLACEECGEPVPADATACPGCGVTFDED